MEPHRPVEQGPCVLVRIEGADSAGRVLIVGGELGMGGKCRVVVGGVEAVEVAQAGEGDIVTEEYLAVVVEMMAKEAQMVGEELVERKAAVISWEESAAMECMQVHG